jgi:XRE family transcriptional regulator, regulator of sulfur utilization
MKYARIPKNIGKNVKKYRKSKGLTQEEIADLIDRSVTYVGYIEQGKRLPSVKTADMIARVLDIKLSKLFE